MRQNGLAGVSSRLGGVPTPPQGAYLKGHAVQGGACITTTPTQVCRGPRAVLPVVVLQRGCGKSKRLYTHTCNYNTTTLLPLARAFSNSHVRVCSAVPVQPPTPKNLPATFPSCPR